MQNIFLLRSIVFNEKLKIIQIYVAILVLVLFFVVYFIFKVNFWNEISIISNIINFIINIIFGGFVKFLDISLDYSNCFGKFILETGCRRKGATLCSFLTGHKESIYLKNLEMENECNDLINDYSRFITLPIIMFCIFF